MAKIAIPGLTMWPTFMGAASPSTTLGTAPADGVLDHANDRVAFVFQCREAGSLTGAVISTTSVPSAQSIDVRLETVSGTHPTGTLATAGATATIASPAANTLYNVDFGTAHTCAAGDVLAIVVRFTSTAGTVYIAKSPHNSGLIMASLFPYVDQDTGTGYIMDDLAPAFAVKLSGVVQPWGGFPAQDVESLSFDSADTPDEMGLRFKVPATLYVCGIFARVRRLSISTSDFRLRLYDNSDVVKFSRTFDDTANITTRCTHMVFGTEYTLPADTVHRITVEALDTGNVELDNVIAGSNDALRSWPGGNEFYLTERTDGGSWTDTNTEVPFGFGLILSGLDDGGGGSSIGGGSLLNRGIN